MNGFSSRSRVWLVAPLAIAFLLIAPRATASDALPTGERQLAQTILEPAYNDLDGTLTYLLTPIKAPENANGDTVAPLYIVLYPTAVAGAIGTVSCQHQPMDNCPDHGPALSGLAESVVPAVYGAGVWGHDHILTAPPAPRNSGGEFSVAWLPVAVLFTDTRFAFNHITTLAQLNAAIDAGQVMTIPLPDATLHGSVVASVPYDNATPVPPAPPLP